MSNSNLQFHYFQVSAVPHFFTHFTRHFFCKCLPVRIFQDTFFVVFNAVHQAPVINLKDFTGKVPGSQADCTLQPCLRELVFALFSGKVPGSTQSAWEEPGSQVPCFIDVCPSITFDLINNKTFWVDLWCQLVSITRF